MVQSRQQHKELNMVQTHYRLIPATPAYPKWSVAFKVFKFDSIRQEYYWVTKGVTTFGSEEKAQEYIKRMTKK